MNRVFAYRTALAALTFSIACVAHAGIFGKKDSGAEVKVINSGPFKGKSTLAIGAFRVTFKTHDTVVSVAGGALMGHGGSSVTDDTTLSGIDHAQMQKIADAIYADFIQQAADKGYTIVDSVKLAAASPEYKALPTTTSFTEGPFGYFVIPTGQTSPIMPTDDYKQERHGAQTFGASFKGIGAQTAKTEANAVFPKVGKDTGAAVIQVNIVVNYAAYKGTQSAWMSNSKATVDFGATIEGVDTALMGTMIKAWDARTPDCGNCMAVAYLKGNVHSSEPMGAAEKRDALGASGNIGNAIGALTGGSIAKHKAYDFTAEPAAYEKNSLAVAKEATEMLLGEIAKEK
ncbi:MAG TPA: hypothetical protein VGN16_16555 [Acidobacteriaceae bacterium]|jgi:hypothetical protein